MVKALQGANSVALASLDDLRRVMAWVDPMISQGPPHTTRSNHPGRALDCGMKLVPLYADEAPSGATASSTVSGYSNVSLPPARQQLIGVKLGKAEIRDLSRTIRTVGRVAVDERRQVLARRLSRVEPVRGVRSPDEPLARGGRDARS